MKFKIAAGLDAGKAIMEARLARQRHIYRYGGALAQAELALREGNFSAATVYFKKAAYHGLRYKNAETIIGALITAEQKIYSKLAEMSLGVTALEEQGEWTGDWSYLDAE